MDKATENYFFLRINELVHVKNQIITFTNLSRDLAISAKEARRILNLYINEQRHKSNFDLGITYVLSGKLKDSNTIALMIVKDHEMEEKENLFECISTKSIYSIQKAHDIDIGALSLVDWFNNNPVDDKPILGSVVSKNSMKRKFKPKKNLPEQKPVLMEKKSSLGKMLSKTESKDVKQKEVHQLSNISTKEDTKSVKSTITISNASSKIMSTVGSNASTKAKTSTGSKGINSTNNKPITGFFQKGSLVKENKTNTRKVLEKENKHVNITSKVEISDPPKEYSAKDRSSSDSRSLSTKVKQKFKRNSVEKSNKNAKKRKRIVEQAESDSDDIWGCEEEEEKSQILIESSDEEPIQKPIPEEVHPKNKKRKFIDQTTTDDDGYIITQKVLVYEEGSDEEEQGTKVEDIGAEVERKKENETSSETKKEDVQVPANNKGKKGKKAAASNQPTLMSFFKRS